MGKRGPTPKSKLEVVDFQPVKYQKPPYGMTNRARNLFKKIIKNSDAGGFDPESISLLRAFCEADNQHYLATNELKTAGAVVSIDTRHGSLPRKSPWFDIQKESAALMSSLSTKLRNKGIEIKPAVKPESKRKGLMFGK